MKHRFPILAKVIILGIGVSILTAGTAIVLSYVNQKKRSEATLINNIDNTLDEMNYVFSDSKDASGYVSDLKALRKYVEPIYDTDPDHKKQSDFPSFDEFKEYYKEKYPWFYPPIGGMGLSKDMAEFQACFYRMTTLLVSCQLSSGCRSAFFAYNDGNGNIVMLSDSRFDRVTTEDPFFHVPGSFYSLKASDSLVVADQERYQGYKLGGYNTRFAEIYDKTGETSPSAPFAIVFIEYDLSSVEQGSLDVLKNELLVLGLSSLTLVVIYALFSYLMFIKNINKLSRASEEIRQSLINKNLTTPIEVTFKSNDEMKTLADSFNEMEKEIINYVDIIHKEAIEKERTNAELSVASKIQLDSLPANKFEDKNVSVRAYIKTAKEVGGDFYDYFYLDDQRLVLLVSDVSGKGIPASLFMMKGKELIKSSLTSHNSLSEAINNVNTRLAKNNKELLFITSFIGVIDFEKKELHYISAGHEKPYIVSKNKVHKLDGDANIVLGIEEGYSFKEESYPFTKDDLIFMYTDGLNESINSKEEEFGYQRIEENLSNIEGLSIDEIVEKINHSLDEFVASEEQFDDVTILVAKGRENELSLHYEKKDYEIITDIIDKFESAFSYVSEETKAAVGIVIDELVNNLISYEKREDLVIDVTFKFTKDGLKVTIKSNGEDYNPFENHKEKYLEEYHSEIKEGGFGLSLVKDLSKSYSYKYKDGHSIVEIITK